MYLKGFWPPIIKVTGLYKLILVWRDFIMTVLIVYISLVHCIDDEILLLDISLNIAVFKRNKGFLWTIRAHKSPQ